MIRTFNTHEVRKQRELTGSGWEFEACQGGHAGEKYRVCTPHCWESHPDFVTYQGEGIYRTVFEAEGNIRLEFKGVSHTAEVMLDGKRIAWHYNAYTAFHTIAKGLEAGEHLLEIRADNRFSEKSALHIPNDYMTYGGVNRPVVLESAADVYVEWVHAEPVKESGSWRLKLQALVCNITDDKQKAEISFQAAGSESFEAVSLEPGEQKIVSSELVCSDVRIWSPEDPALYFIKTLVIMDGAPVDDMIDRFGFREVRIEGKKILLNDRAIRIKGFCRHEDHPQFGCALPYSAIAADLDLIADMGGNSVRTVHYPNDEIMLDLCDERGILVWEENHARGLSLENMQNPNFEPQAEAVTGEMVTAHFNHPSIYIWGILNECASDTEYGKECYEKQYAIIKELDTSRPRSSASCRFKTDICLGYPEVVSYNIYPEWYVNRSAGEYLDDLYRWVQEKSGGTGKPFLITETGAGAVYGFRTPIRSKWSEEYQAEALESQIKAVMSQEGCSGLYIWQFCDVRVSEEWFASRPRTMNNKGVVDEYRRRKLAYEVVKRLYREIPSYE